MPCHAIPYHAMPYPKLDPDASAARYPSQTSTIPYQTICMPYGEDPAAHGHWCAFTDLYHTIPYHAMPRTLRPPGIRHRHLPYHTMPCRVFPCPDHINIGFLGRWGTYACPQCLPSDIVPIRSWTWTLRPPDIRHRHLPCHAIPYHARPYAHGHWCTFTDLYHTMPYHTIPYHTAVFFFGLLAVGITPTTTAGMAW